RGITFGPDGNLYVTSPRSDRVLRFHGSTGALLGSFVTAGAGGLDEPAGIRFGPDGALYVSSSTTNDVKRFDGATGQFRDVFAVGGGLAHSTFLTFSPAAVANRSPIAKAGEDVQVQSTGAPVQVQLDGTHSCDLDADPLSYEWREGAAFLGSTPTIAPFLALGVHTITLTIRDPFLAVSQDQVTVSVLQTIPPPSNLTATAVSSSTIHLSWQDNSSDEDGFEIERRAGGAFVPVAISGPNSAAYADNGLQPLTTYAYRIRSVKAGGISSYTPEAGATTLTAPTAAPSDLTAGAVSDTEVRLHWIDNSNTETGFRIERRLANGLFAQIATFGASPSSGRAVNFLDALEVVADTTYGYRVRATGPGGDSQYSNEATVTTTPIPPSAPTALTLAASSATAIQVSWTDTSNNETGFRVERKIGTGSFAFIGEAPADLPNFPDLGLAPDTFYTYRVRATGTIGSSAFADEATLPTPPLAPSGLGITVPAPRQLALTWTDNSQSETGFKVQRRTSSGVFTLAGVVSAGVTSFLDTGVAAGVTYTYQIRATNAGGDSAPSASAMRLTLPATPTNLTVTPFSSTQLDLNWTDGNPSPPPIKVERSTDGVNYSPVTVTPGASTSYRDNALTPETTYHYRIRTTNATGDSELSLPASGRTFPPPPASPGALVAVAVSGRSVQLSWQDRSNNEAGFEIWRLGPTGPYQRVTFAPANSTAHLDRLDLSGLTGYRYRIRAINEGGGSVFIQSDMVNTPADVPAPPASPGAVSLSSSQIRITWADASDNETGFQVERKPAGGSFALATTTAAGATEFVDGSRAESAAYTYRVIAVNAQGSSPPSAEVTATTRPAAPGGLEATAGNRKVDLSWADNSALESGFRIERKDGANAFTPLHTVAAGVRSYSDASVTAGVSYTYRVLATSASGDSAPSNESSATPRNETPLAKLVVAPKTVKFGTLRRGKSGKRTFKLTNKGKEALSGTVGAVSAPFVLTSGGGAFTLAPKKSRVVTLTWTPNVAGAVTGVVQVTSTDPRLLQVDVRVTGKAR
ncbi:MAG: fibronectin type III domain-containing protein, partial [Actinomycetota bacterium]